MSLIRKDRNWGLDPFQEISRFENEMRRLFANFFGDRDLAFEERNFAPLVDIRDVEDQFILEADIPGFKKEDITIEVTPETIDLSAQHKEEKEEKKEGKYLRRERCAYKFRRQISLPSPIDTGRIESSFEDGTLKLTLPKTPGTEKKRINL
jgi:HSP20 family protein